MQIEHYWSTIVQQLTFIFIYLPIKNDLNICKSRYLIFVKKSKFFSQAFVNIESFLCFFVVWNPN